MTVDLEALKAELEAAGIPVRKKLSWSGKLEALPFSITSDGVAYWGPLGIKAEDWTALDIIRRHIVPVSPGRADREAVVDRETYERIVRRIAAELAWCQAHGINDQAAEVTANGVLTILFGYEWQLNAAPNVTDTDT